MLVLNLNPEFLRESGTGLKASLSVLPAWVRLLPLGPDWRWLVFWLGLDMEGVVRSQKRREKKQTQKKNFFGKNITTEKLQVVN